MVHILAEEFAALCATPVSASQWDGFLNQHVPHVDARLGRPLESRALTVADRKHGTLELLYRSDARVCPWLGTAHGVLQNVNT